MIRGTDIADLRRSLSAALVALMLLMQAVIVLHYPVHLLEGMSQHSPLKPDHHGDDACPVCFVAKSLFSLVIAFALLALTRIAVRFAFSPAAGRLGRAGHARPFHARGPPAFA